MMAVANASGGGGGNADVKKVQTIHGITADGILGPVTRSKIQGFQRQYGLPVTGTLDSRTLALYKSKWPYYWGGAVSGGGVSTTNGVADPMAKGGFLEMVIKTVILYGIFKVLMKVF